MTSLALRMELSSGGHVAGWVIFSGDFHQFFFFFFLIFATCHGGSYYIWLKHTCIHILYSGRWHHLNVLSISLSLISRPKLSSARPLTTFACRSSHLNSPLPRFRFHRRVELLRFHCQHKLLHFSTSWLLKLEKEEGRPRFEPPISTSTI